MGFRDNEELPSHIPQSSSFSRTKDMIWQHDMFEDSMIAAGLTGIESGTKLYISNLDYGVSNEDIRELFSEIGPIKRCAVHYDRSGRSSGSAEVVFTKRSNALAAVKRYNNVQLDGKPMKIELIGTNLGMPVSARVNVTGGAGRGRRTVVMTPEFGPMPGVVSGGHGTRWGRGRGGFRRGGRGGRGRGVGGRGRGRGRGRNQAPPPKSADELDKELESYHANAN
ncbi:THO complex subunit 4D isoform X2 [Amborella trichopoda]|uniref:THO complex subunit 4D isoform X2 n=1 Tax=Amborella trichopoda TaxID=13333 RepID=UPI0009C14A94|nr:THO complex subunit 4D isoform X2 [Amborella trichopoda]|eukprot:XP_020520751.1 THO complex subunit 4D isoform X2 [Amborella trichopoda]